MTVKIEIAGTDEAAFRDVFRLIMAEHAEVGFVALDVAKATEQCYRTLDQGMTFIARDDAGVAVGTLGIVDLAFWYADERFLQDVWFYVTPEHRGGSVGRALLDAARALAEERRQLLFVTIANPKRRIRRSPRALAAEEAGYVPFTYTMRLA